MFPNAGNAILLVLSLTAATIVGVMLRVLPSTLMFYLISGAVVFIMAAGLFATVARENGLALVVFTAPLGAACFLIYARLIGRLSMMIHRRNPTKAEWDVKPK